MPVMKWYQVIKWYLSLYLLTSEHLQAATQTRTVVPEMVALTFKNIPPIKQATDWCSFRLIKSQFGVKQNYCPASSEKLIPSRKVYIIISTLLDSGPWAEAFLEIGSVHLSIHPFIIFLGINSLKFSETWDVIKGPYGDVHERVRNFLVKSPLGENDQKWLKNDPITVFGLLK